MATLTFLNTTGSPGLSPDAARKMRGHITRVNFAKRRQWKERTRTSKEGNESERAGAAGTKMALLSEDLTLTELLLFRSGSNVSVSSCNANQITVSQLWSLMFLDGNTNQGDGDELATWLTMLISDRTLLDATLAIGMRHWSPEPMWKWNAGIHTHRAVSSMIKRIGSGRASTDGALGAALTMAFGERLASNHEGWNVHIDGVAQMIYERRSQGISSEPAWFDSLMVCDSINYALGYPRMYHRKIIEALESQGNPAVIHVADVVDKIIELRKSINAYNKGRTSSTGLTRNISQKAQDINNEIIALQKSDTNTEVRAASFSLQILVHISWPSSPPANLSPIASKLRAALETRKVSQCSYMDMTSCQLILGAIAAEHGSETQAWFMGRRRAAITALRSRGWARPIIFGEQIQLLLDQVLTEPLRMASNIPKPLA